MARASWIDIVEAAYDVEGSEESWLRRIASASKSLDDGYGVSAFAFDASTPESMRIHAWVSTPAQTVFGAGHILGYIGAMPGGGGDYVRATFRVLQGETVTRTPGFEGKQGAARFAMALGVGDAVGINAVDSAGLGVWLGAPLREATRLSSVQRTRYARIATHLAAAHRLRRRLVQPGSPAWGADAVLSPKGDLQHAEDDDSKTVAARQSLREAAIAIDRARGRLRFVEPDSALGQWMGLVDGRWSLVDKFDRDGKRYVLARRNEPDVHGLGVLTARERAAVAYAALGHTNKLIAYDLGIAHATVRVLMHRAAAKLGARDRAHLVAIVSASNVGPPSSRRPFKAARPARRK